MTLEIITPEAVLYAGEAEVVTLPGTQGQFQILDNHAPIVSSLGEGEVRIKGNLKLSKEATQHFTQKEGVYSLPIQSGTVELNNNKVVVLID